MTLFLSLLKLSAVMKNISKENYLSTIYRHRNTEGGIKATQLAEQLEISNAAVTGGNGVGFYYFNGWISFSMNK